MQPSAYQLTPWQPDPTGLVLYVLLVAGLLGVMLFLAGWVGSHRPNRNKSLVYECGIVPDSDARFAYPAPYYLIAVFFLVFDLEGVFLFSWAVASRELGLVGWLRITIFILILLLSLAYLWRKGGLDWGSPRLQNPGGRPRPY